jgi:ribosomal protein L10
MDAETHQLTASSITDKDLLDRNAMAGLLEQTEAKVARVYADGAYDFEQCYRAIKQKQAIALIPPREDAVVQGKSPFEARDENVCEGLKAWAEKNGRKRAPITNALWSRQHSSD